MAALKYCVDSNKELMAIFAFSGYYIHQDDFKAMQAELETHSNAEFLPGFGDMLVIRGENENIVTVKLCGGSNGNAIDIKQPAKRTRRESHEQELMQEAPIKKKSRTSNNSTSNDEIDAARAHYNDSDNDEEAGALTQECAGLF